MGQGLLLQPVRISTGYLNTVNDAVAGQSVAPLAGLPSFHTGFLGSAVAMAAKDAAARASVNPLYGGIYQYVQFKAGTTAANIRGGPVYWSNAESYVVTPDVPTGVPEFAGISLNAVSGGNFGWILVEGKTHCHALATVTKAAPAIGDSLVLATAGAFDDLADATAFTGSNFKLVVGQWLEAPVSATGGGLYLARVFTRGLNL